MPPRTRLQSASATLQPIASAKPLSSVKAEPSPKKAKSAGKSPIKEHKTTVKQALAIPQPAPTRWKEAYQLISKQRETFVAPVDVMGCDKAGDVDLNNAYSPSHREDQIDEETTKKLNQRSEKDRRLACLVSLMLSSQTRDEITAQATLNLRRQLKGSLTVDSLRNSSLVDIENCINKVGFWRKKAQFLKFMADDLSLKHDGDVPKTLEELVALKGVGPKMAFLALSSAWSINLGIGVDTHVHRITNRLGWVKTSDPEATRVHLESWLPHHLFQEINRLLVGFGQVICLPVGPKCDSCFVGKVEGLCPSANLKSKVNNKRKTAKKTITTDVSIEKNQKSNKIRRKIETTIDNIKSNSEDDQEIKDGRLKASRFFKSSEKIDPLEEDEDEKIAVLDDASTSRIKIEIEDLKHNDIKVKEENDHNEGLPPAASISSPLSDIVDEDDEDRNSTHNINRSPRLCSSQSFSW